jgi:hypothetical protein
MALVASIRKVIDAQMTPQNLGGYSYSAQTNTYKCPGWDIVYLWGLYAAYENVGLTGQENYVYNTVGVDGGGGRVGHTIGLSTTNHVKNYTNWTGITPVSNFYNSNNFTYNLSGLKTIFHTMQFMKNRDSSKTTLPSTMGGAAGNGSGTFQMSNLSIGDMRGVGASPASTFKYTRTADDVGQGRPGGDNVSEHLVYADNGSISFGGASGTVTQPPPPPPVGS